MGSRKALIVAATLRREGRRRLSGRAWVSAQPPAGMTPQESTKPHAGKEISRGGNYCGVGGLVWAVIWR
ncbi:MAG: hypothetical protein ACP5H2_12035, partial [Solirubrobacteraceae bacterium]